MNTSLIILFEQQTDYSTRLLFCFYNYNWLTHDEAVFFSCSDTSSRTGSKAFSVHSLWVAARWATRPFTYDWEVESRYRCSVSTSRRHTNRTAGSVIPGDRYLILLELPRQFTNQNTIVIIFGSIIFHSKTLANALAIL